MKNDTKLHRCCPGAKPQQDIFCSPGLLRQIVDSVLCAWWPGFPLPNRSSQSFLLIWLKWSALPAEPRWRRTYILTLDSDASCFLRTSVPTQVFFKATPKGMNRHADMRLEGPLPSATSNKNAPGFVLGGLGAGHKRKVPRATLRVPKRRTWVNLIFGMRSPFRCTRWHGIAGSYFYRRRFLDL